jgi:hypothetical protein
VGITTYFWQFVSCGSLPNKYKLFNDTTSKNIHDLLITINQLGLMKPYIPSSSVRLIDGIACGNSLLRIPSSVFMISSSIFILSKRKSLGKK